MYIKVTDSKELLMTIPTTIYCGEANADLITFLVPMNYGERNLADCMVAMRYVLPSGVGHSEALVYHPEPYKNYLQFSTPVNTRLTAEAGEITLWLSVFHFDEGVVLKTSEIIIPVSPGKNITDYLPADDLEQIDQLAAKVAALETGKADDLSYSPEDKMLQLTAGGTPVGRAIDMSEMVNEDDVINFAPAPSPDEPDAVIHF